MPSPASAAAPEPSLLLFDLGGVLVRNAGFARLNELMPAPLDLEVLKSRLLTSPAYRAFERGHTEPGAFAQAIVTELELRCSPRAFIAEFEAWVIGFYEGAEDLLARLRRRYRTACLSNSNALHWNRFAGFTAQFDLALSSHLLGTVKPDADCFAQALRICAVAPAQVLFFDDALLNVEAARACGMRALHVTDFDALQREIARLGLLDEARGPVAPGGSR